MDAWDDDGSLSGWLELPRLSGKEDYVGYVYSGGERNYSFNYQYSTYTALWVAYPLYQSSLGGSRSGKWTSNPELPTGEQINIWSGSYGVNVSQNNFYARGHQIPDADRSGNPSMQAQTYYATNSTPQLQNRFNSGIWLRLEDAVRKAVPENDTLYVVTGASFYKAGIKEKVEWISPKYDSSKVPVPNYYWKVLLKVKRGRGGRVVSASGIGFWIDHREHTDAFTSYAVSIDAIEKFTGFDFFPLLGDRIEAAAESNSDFESFKAF